MGDGGWWKAIQIDAVEDDADAVFGKAKPLAHETAEILRGRDEQINVRATFRKSFPGERAGRFRQGVEKIVLALQHAGDRRAQFSFEPAREPGEQGVGKADDVGLVLG